MCIHHWIIEDQSEDNHKETWDAQCKKCGERTEFPTSISNINWTAHNHSVGCKEHFWVDFNDFNASHLSAL